jgi:hypothetical protein
MTIAYRPPPTRVIPPVPPEFPAEFIAGGWRRVERLYGARTDLLLKWVQLSGGQSLYAARAAHMRQTGKSGACRNVRAGGL